MRTILTGLAIGALLLAGGCALPAATVHGKPGAGATTGKGAAHESAQFLVNGGGNFYRVNVQYVSMLAQSVIVVRQGKGAADASWRPLDVSGLGNVPSGEPFSAKVWRPVALKIADAVRQQKSICPADAPMQIVESGGSPSTMYRDSEQAWVIFATCPNPSKG